MIFLCLAGDPACDWLNCIAGVLCVTSPVWGIALLGFALRVRRLFPTRPKLRIEKAHVVMYPGAVRPEAISEKNLQTALDQGAKYIEPYSHRGFTYSIPGEDIDVPNGYMVVEE